MGGGTMEKLATALAFEEGAASNADYLDDARGTIEWLRSLGFAVVSFSESRRHAPEFIKKICELKNAATARETAAQFGISRNAVIGIWHRSMEAGRRG